jgi:hypothetical protein
MVRYRVHCKNEKICFMPRSYASGRQPNLQSIPSITSGLPRTSQTSQACGESDLGKCDM